MISLFLACSMSSPATLVDELRVMAIQTEPAELSPFDTEATLSLLIADPAQKGADVVYWTCTNLGDGCLEAQFFSEDLAAWPQTFTREELLTQRPISVPMPLAGVLEQLPPEAIPFYGSIMWVFACTTGECTFIDDIQNGQIDPEVLASPLSLVEDLPFGVASLAFKSIPVSTRPTEEKIQNPTLTPLFDDTPTQPVEETLDLSFSYQLNTEPNEDSLIYGYATIGGFSEADRSNSQLQQTEGTATLPWFAPEEAGEGSVYVILENGIGGTGIWYSDAQVIPAP